ncbi:MAG: hypothetical protein AAGE89_07990 [Pseudomonadota bacterium]
MIRPLKVLCASALLLLAAATLPAKANETIIFLHNAWYEANKNGEAHPKFGVYDLEGIKEALAADGATVIAPVREEGSTPSGAAKKLKSLIGGLVYNGAGSLKIVGASKGGLIAKLTSAEIQPPSIKWVIVGGCHNERLSKQKAPIMRGTVLSIYETSDEVAGPCADHPEIAANTAVFEEKAISTGKGHGFQFSPDEAWVKLAREW